MIERKRYLDKLISKKGNGLVKIITGIRRCGKSYLLFNICKNYLRSVGVADDCMIRLALDGRQSACECFIGCCVLSGAFVYRIIKNLKITYKKTAKLLNYVYVLTFFFRCGIMEMQLYTNKHL